MANNHQLVELIKLDPTLVLDIRYATKNNFTGQQVYTRTQAFLVKSAAQALIAAHEDFKNLGYKLKIWDAYRPRAIQYKFWELQPDERYVSSPAKGSKHNRGCAVDCTLVDVQGNELDMGTEFDDFSERAHSTYTDLTATQRANRKLLQKTLAKHGFTVLTTEWWHFDYQGWQNHPLLDIPFEKL